MTSQLHLTNADLISFFAKYQWYYTTIEKYANIRTQTQACPFVFTPKSVCSQ